MWCSDSNAEHSQRTDVHVLLCLKKAGEMAIGKETLCPFLGAFYENG